MHKIVAKKIQNLSWINESQNIIRKEKRGKHDQKTERHGNFRPNFI